MARLPLALPPGGITKALMPVAKSGKNLPVVRKSTIPANTQSGSVATVSSGHLSAVPEAAQGMNFVASNAPVNPISSGKDFFYSMFSGVSKMLSPQTYTTQNLTRAMMSRTNIAKDAAEGIVKKGRGRNGAYEGISHIDRLKLAHMNSDGTYNKAAIAGSFLTAGAVAGGVTHAAIGDNEVTGVPFV